MIRESPDTTHGCSGRAGRGASRTSLKQRPLPSTNVVLSRPPWVTIQSLAWEQTHPLYSSLKVKHLRSSPPQLRELSGSGHKAIAKVPSPQGNRKGSPHLVPRLMEAWSLFLLQSRCFLLPHRRSPPLHL